MPLRARHWCALLFLLAFSVRVAGVFATHQYRDLDRFELERIAISLATTGVFGDPYAIPTGPSAHVSPGYPLLLAGIFRLFGTGVPAEIVKQIFACAVTAFQCAMLPLIALRFRFDWRTGAIAGLAAALLPLKFKTESQGDWESNWAALALMLVTVVTVELWRRKEFTWKQAAGAGAAWGVCLLFSWAFIFFFIVVVAAGFLVAGRAGAARYVGFCIVLVATAAFCLAPWAIRNQLALGALTPGRTNSGLELRLSNNDLASPNERVNFEAGLYNRYHPLQSVAEAQKVRELGEVEYNRRAMAEARRWIASHPQHFLRLTLERIGLFWFYPGENLPKTAILWSRVVLAFAGLALVWRSDRLSASVLGLLLLVVPLPNYFVHVGLKHSYPLDWALTLLAARCVTSFGGFQGRRAGDPSGMVTSKMS